jgi:DNA-binding FadR family transcriptional regulator
VGAARLAAQRRSDEDVIQMRELLARRNAAAALGDLDETVAIDVALHRAIGNAAHNPVLTDLYENFLAVVYENVLVNTTARGGLDPKEHVVLVEAIAAGDPARAAAEAACFLDALLDRSPG